ncbi:MAG: T9SS type A sorting domain-containing protein [Ignavibacteriaceae bacterium]|nr:T9SS type A sorting domain-containing protein [Ignavibacteriaceae bacterium]
MQGTGRSTYIGPRNANYVIRKDMPLGVSFGPVIGYDDILFTGSASLNTDPFNRFYSLNFNLDTIWTFITPSAWPNNNGSTLGADSTIYFASNGGGIYAIDYSGNLKWKKEGITLGGYPFIAIAKNGNLYLSERNRLLILDKNGNTIKDSTVINFATREFLFSVGGDTIYFINYDDNDNKTLKAADLNLNIFWSIDIYDTKQGIPLIDNSNKIYLYTRDGPSECYFKCILPDGSIAWQFPFRSFSEFSSPAIDKNGNFIIAVKRDTSVLVEVISLDYYGNENWSKIIRSEQSIVEGNIITDAERKIYLVSEGFNEESYLHCLDSDGLMLWEVFVGDNSFISSTAINSNGVVYVGGFKSTTYPFHTQNLVAVSEHPLDVVTDYYFMSDFELSQNYPNPFNSFTNIDFIVPYTSKVTIKIFDISGKEVAVLVKEVKEAGAYSISFNTDKLSSGIYFYSMISGSFRSVRKMVLLK